VQITLELSFERRISEKEEDIRREWKETGEGEMKRERIKQKGKREHKNRKAEERKNKK
jgi:hypothetical protein